MSIAAPWWPCTVNCRFARLKCPRREGARREGCSNHGMHERRWALAYRRGPSLWSAPSTRAVRLLKTCQSEHFVDIVVHRYISMSDLDPSSDHSRSGTDDEPEVEDVATTSAQTLPKKLDKKKLKKLKEEYKRRGVVYISRIPPHLVRKGVEPVPSDRRQLPCMEPPPLHIQFPGSETRQTAANAGGAWQDRASVPCS